MPSDCPVETQTKHGPRDIWDWVALVIVAVYILEGAAGTGASYGADYGWPLWAQILVGLSMLTIVPRAFNAIRCWDGDDAQ